MNFINYSFFRMQENKNDAYKFLEMIFLANLNLFLLINAIKPIKKIIPLKHFGTVINLTFFKIN